MCASWAQLVGMGEERPIWWVLVRFARGSNRTASAAQRFGRERDPYHLRGDGDLIWTCSSPR